MTDCKIEVWTIKGYDKDNNLVLLYKIKANNHNLGSILIEILNNYWVYSVDCDYSEETD